MEGVARLASQTEVPVKKVDVGSRIDDQRVKVVDGQMRLSKRSPAERLSIHNQDIKSRPKDCSAESPTTHRKHDSLPAVSS